VIGIVALVLCLVMGVVSLVATYLAIVERDLLKAVVLSAVQSTAYAFIYYALAAPDIVLVYIPVAVGLYPLILLILIKKTERFEKP